MKFFAYAALILGAAAVRLQQKEAAEHITPPNTQELQTKKDDPACYRMYSKYCTGRYREWLEGKISFVQYSSNGCC